MSRMWSTFQSLSIELVYVYFFDIKEMSSVVNSLRSSDRCFHIDIWVFGASHSRDFRAWFMALKSKKKGEIRDLQSKDDWEQMLSHEGLK